MWVSFANWFHGDIIMFPIWNIFRFVGSYNSNFNRTIVRENLQFAVQKKGCKFYSAVVHSLVSVSERQEKKHGQQLRSLCSSFFL